MCNHPETFAQFEQQISSLQEENSELKARIDSLEESNSYFLKTIQELRSSVSHLRGDAYIYAYGDDYE